MIAAAFAWGTVRIAGVAHPAALLDGREVVVIEGVASLADLIAGGPALWRDARERAVAATTRLSLEEVEPLLPVAPTDYVDFYASIHHATNVGRMFRPDRPLAANWRHLPIGYHGRSSTVVASGTPVRRPSGQRGPGDFGPTRALDFECELGFFCGPSTRIGERVPIGEAASRIFGVVLLNDWSARDVQGFESVPLGPFLGKSFATSISPWIVPPDLLPTAPAPPQEPEPVEYLRDPEPRLLDVPLEVAVNGETIVRTSGRHLYWTLPQMLAHATVNGAALTAGDLFGTGTVSGPDPGSEACLLELWRGERWLQDGDEVVMSSPLLGEVRGRVEPA